ncbi:MAG: hypothetical protein R6V13_05320 [Anaerolineae bacterium]
MSRRTTVLLISLVAVLILGGCEETVLAPSPTAEEGTIAPQKADTATPVPSTPLAESEVTSTEEAVIETEATPALPPGPALLAPPDETLGTVIDLVWAWEQELDEDEWFELQIWPDDPEAEPEAYGWYKEKQERVTSATLYPGRYLWQVLVVQGREKERGEVMELDYVEPPCFTLVRPSLRRGDPGVIPVATATPTPQPVWPTATPTGPTSTPTDTSVQPTPTETVEATDTPVSPTDTPEPTGYPGTETPVLPTATPTDGDYPHESPTPSTEPTDAYP